MADLSLPSGYHTVPLARARRCENVCRSIRPMGWGSTRPCPLNPSGTRRRGRRAERLRKQGGSAAPLRSAGIDEAPLFFQAPPRRSASLLAQLVNAAARGER